MSFWHDIALYTMWDQNHNRMIESAEWSHAIENYLDVSETDPFDFSEFDKNEDDQLDINEFRQAVAQLDDDHLAQIFDNDPANIAAATKYEVWYSGEDETVKVNVGDHTIEYKGLAGDFHH